MRVFRWRWHRINRGVIQPTVMIVATIGALLFAFVLGLRGVGAFENAEARRIEQINLGAPIAMRAGVDHDVASLHADARMALSGAGLTLAIIVVGLLGTSLSERRERDVLAARVESLIRTDNETGAANRRAWEERLAHELSQSRRLGYPVTIALIEVDHLKDYTKKERRDAGDRVLSELAGNWVPVLRKGDLMGRFSSELFSVLLPGCPSEQAEALLERLCRLVPARQSVSAGVATWHWRESIESLLERTHAALEEAKAGGGSRITLSRSAPPNVDRPAHKRVAQIVDESIGYESSRDVTA